MCLRVCVCLCPSPDADLYPLAIPTPCASEYCAHFVSAYPQVGKRGSAAVKRRRYVVCSWCYVGFRKRGRQPRVASFPWVRGTVLMHQGTL